MLKWLVLVSIKYNHPLSKSIIFNEHWWNWSEWTREERKYTFMYKYINNYDNFLFKSEEPKLNLNLCIDESFLHLPL